MQIKTEQDLTELKSRIDFSKFMHVREYPSKQNEAKSFKEKFSQLQENAPFQVSDFSDELKKSGGVLCDVVQRFPTQIKSFSPELLNDYRYEMADFFEWWFGRVIYDNSRSQKSLIAITKFFFQITDNDLWFYKNMLYIGMLEFTTLPKQLQSKELVLSLLDNEAMRNKIGHEKITFPKDFLDEHGIVVEIFPTPLSRMQACQQVQSEIYAGLLPEINNRLNQGEIFSIDQEIVNAVKTAFELGKVDVLKHSINPPSNDTDLSEMEKAKEELLQRIVWGCICHFYDKKENPELVKNGKQIMLNIDEYMTLYNMPDVESFWDGKL